jgi:hypothetical protein
MMMPLKSSNSVRLQTAAKVTAQGSRNALPSLLWDNIQVQREKQSNKACEHDETMGFIH